MAEEEEAAALAPEEITFGLPDEILQVLPSDPFTQLDVARRITSLALATRVSALESEAADLRHQLSDKDQIVDELRSRIESLDTALSDATDKLAAAQQEKEELLQEKAQLSNTVRKLNRDVSKLEVFRKTLMQSLQEDEDGSGGAKVVPSYVKPTTQSIGGDDDPVEPPSAYSSMQSQTSEPVNSFAEIRDSDAEHRLHISPGLLLASQTNTPKLTPPGSLQFFQHLLPRKLLSQHPLGDIQSHLQHQEECLILHQIHLVITALIQAMMEALKHEPHGLMEKNFSDK